MIVEYLFEMSPFTLLLIVFTFLFLLSKNFTRTVTKEKVKYAQIENNFKKYRNQSAEGEKKSFTVASYNIMAHNFTKYEWFPHCSPQYLESKYRSPRIIAELEDLNADIVCLQECDCDLIHEFYKVNLESLGYNTVIKISPSTRIVTNIIAYKKNVFRQESIDHIDLNQIELEKLDQSFQRFKEALIVNLTHHESGQTIQIVNTHLFWNPEFEYVKYGQLSKIVTYVERTYKKTLPVIFCGDFNALPTSNVLKYIYKQKPLVTTNQKGDYNKNKLYIEKFFTENMHSFNLRSAYDCYKSDEYKKKSDWAEQHPDFTTNTEEFVGTLDYIVFTENNLNLVEVLKIPTTHPEIKTEKLPNKIFPSKHVKIAAKFEFQ